MATSSGNIATAFDYLETPFRDQYYGPISDALAAELSKWDEPGVEVIRMPVHEGGFTRTNVR